MSDEQIRGATIWERLRIMITHVKTVAVYVEDQDKDLAFFTGKLGFEVRRKEQMGPNAQWIELAPKGAETCLVIYPNAMMKDWSERKPSVVFHCQDAEATYKELSARGVNFTEAPKRMPWGVYAQFVDPDGNVFLLTSPP